MYEVLSDDRFVELFGNEPYPDFSPDSTGKAAKDAKKSYVGIRPSDFDIDRAGRFLFESKHLGPLEFFGVMPSILRAFVIDPTRRFDHLEIYSIEIFIDEMDPSGADAQHLDSVFEDLKFTKQHIEYMVSMLRQFRFQVTTSNDPSYIAPKSLTSVQQALDCAIQTLELVL